jgi:hypothetical protein
LNDIVAQLWPHINVAGCKMIKEIAEPMFKSMLPGPLATLHFTKLDLGHVPLELSNLLVTKTETDGIKLDLNVDWAGKCDIALDASMIPTVVSSIPLVLLTYKLRANSLHRGLEVLHFMAGFPSCWVH